MSNIYYWNILYVVWFLASPDESDDEKNKKKAKKNVDGRKKENRSGDIELNEDKKDDGNCVPENDDRNASGKSKKKATNNDKATESDNKSDEDTEIMDDNDKKGRSFWILYIIRNIASNIFLINQNYIYAIVQRTTP